ncbi:glutamate ABC transporter substrate-binding protein [Aeromicrobium sp. CF4.19]|uniref:glutamate ABC transporter substrate-binding protein n=1 Tax=Aeromicrobium sp. CF4.19 TaxID=3373082 RepID=UPI003EE5338A
MKRTKAAALVGGLVLALAGCGGDDGGTEVQVEENPEFEAGTVMNGLSEAGKITIGVKYDQPGLGYLPPGADTPEGFDVEMAKIIAGQLGIAPEDIVWEQAVTENREPFLQNGAVDLVLSTYSISDERRELVGQAGPYYLTGQQLLVREEDKDRITGPEDLEGAKVCAVSGSTSIKTVTEEYGAEPVPFDSYADCVTQLLNGSVDVVTTDGAILLGSAAQQPDELEVVGEPFSEERYGIGYSPDAPEMCEFLNDALQRSHEDGSWAEAFEATLGESGVETPEPPMVDENC